jgi:hypothetical protein
MPACAERWELRRQVGIGAEPGEAVHTAHQLLEDVPAAGRFRTKDDSRLAQKGAQDGRGLHQAAHRFPHHPGLAEEEDKPQGRDAAEDHLCRRASSQDVRAR